MIDSPEPRPIKLRFIGRGLRWGLRRLGVSAGVLFAGAVVAAAPPAAWGGGVSGQPGSAAVSADDLAARAVARVALTDLRLVSEPRSRDYRVTAALLEYASSLAPDDEHILRYAIDAASSGGDSSLAVSLSQRLIRLDPSDTVAQLRLISARINTEQDADARLALYRNFLGDRGSRIDRSIRSRLALDAALLLRERGDVDGFAEMLTRALELDGTNKDAASLAVTFFTQRVDDAPGRLELLLTLLYADPFDVETHQSIARELAAGGAYRASARFYDTMLMVASRLGVELPDEVYAERQNVLWSTEGADSLLRSARDELDRQRRAVAQRRRQLEEAGRPMEGVPLPDDLGLGLDVCRVLAVASSVTGDEARQEWAFRELERTVEAQRRRLSDPENLPRGVSAEDARRRLRQLDADFAWICLWAGRRVDAAGARLEELLAEGETRASAARRLRGWLALREGRLDDAERLLSPLAEVDLLARLGMGVLAEERGDRGGAAEIYSAISRSGAGTLAGVWAGSKYAGLTGRSARRPEQAGTLEAIAATVPGWLEEMIRDPRRFLSISAGLHESTLGPLGSPLIRLTVRNVGPIPLGLSPNGPVHTRLMLSPRLEVGPYPIREGVLPEVVTMDRRLRLSPRETLEFSVLPTLGVFGQTMDRMCGMTARVRWRVLQNFVLTQRGVFEAGPFGVATETGTLARRPLPLANMDPDLILEAAREANGAGLAEAILAVNWRLGMGATERMAGDFGERAARVFAERYRAAPATERAMMLAMLPTGNQLPAFSVFDDAARVEGGEWLLLLYAVTRVTEEDDPLLDELVGSEDRRMSRVGEAIRSRLSEGVNTYSRAAQAQPGGRTGNR